MKKLFLILIVAIVFLCVGGCIDEYRTHARVNIDAGGKYTATNLRVYSTREATAARFELSESMAIDAINKELSDGKITVQQHAEAVRRVQDGHYSLVNKKETNREEYDRTYRVKSSSSDSPSSNSSLQPGKAAYVGYAAKEKAEKAQK